MTLDLENVERENDNLTDTDQTECVLAMHLGTSEGRCLDRVLPASSGVHDGLAVALAEGRVEEVAVILGQVVAHEGLTTVLVDTLHDLVGGGIAETGEEGEETSTEGSSGLVLEDDRVELGHANDLALVAHETFGDGVDGVEDGELGDTSGTCFESTTCSFVLRPSVCAPAPRILAVVDSFLYSLDEPDRTSPALFAPSLGEGTLTIVTCVIE